MPTDFRSTTLQCYKGSPRGYAFVAPHDMVLTGVRWAPGSSGPVLCGGGAGASKKRSLQVRIALVNPSLSCARSISRSRAHTHPKKRSLQVQIALMNPGVSLSPADSPLSLLPAHSLRIARCRCKSPS